MTGPDGAEGFEFEVRPRLLAAYAEAIRAGAADLASIGATVEAVRVEREWFGRLPQSGRLADRYALHREGELAAAKELAVWLAEAARGLAESAGRYSAADRVVAGVAGTVAAGLGVGIEIPGTEPSADASGGERDPADAGTVGQSGGGEHGGALG
jgi:hypothetical protein